MFGMARVAYVLFASRVGAGRRHETREWALVGMNYLSRGPNDNDTYTYSPACTVTDLDPPPRWLLCSRKTVSDNPTTI